MTSKLETYHKKRNFDKTTEPTGGEKDKGEKLRFVVQHHLASRDHYDFRLEWQGTMLSWAVPKGPSYNPRDKRLAVHVEDHPLEYRNFEGTIPKGEYGGGTVMIWDEGFWEPLNDTKKGLEEGSLKFTLYGVRLLGNWALAKMKDDQKKGGDNWLLIKEKDEFDKDTDGISGYTTSVRTGRTMEEIERGEEKESVKNPFDKTEVQLAKLVSSVPQEKGWLYELKYDGYRILAYVEDGGIRLVSRNGNDYTQTFAAAANALKGFAAGRSMVLDGEMVVAGAGGKTDFQGLQNYVKKPSGKNLVYIVFDLLALDGKDFRKLPLIERKEKLETIMKDAPEGLRYSRHIEDHGEESFAAACKSGMEGVIGKKASSPYSGTRGGDWIKIKCDNRQEFVIGGYTVSEKKKEGEISSVLLGYFEDGELIFAGKAGSGISGKSEKLLIEKIKGLKRDTPPFKTAPKEKGSEQFFWVEPQLIAEIKYSEWTKEGLLRQASFKGLRDDKEVESVKKEIADTEIKEESQNSEREEKAKDGELTVRGIKISNPDKILFDDDRITKADVIRYYDKVSVMMLPYTENRLLSIVRCPKGIAEACFYKKHPGPGSKAIKTMKAEEDGGEYFYIDNPEGLIAEAQMGTLEFHAWGSQINNLEHPDMMVFDLDPDEGMELKTVREGVKNLKGVLDGLSLPCYLKTSGGKGYHVVVPFMPAPSWEVFHGFARRVAEVMEKKWPERYTPNSRKIKRGGKIFIDWMRNGRGATSIVPYSLRARKGARVSMPIRWEELDKIAPDGITMKEAVKRLDAQDPWAGFFDHPPQFQ